VPEPGFLTATLKAQSRFHDPAGESVGPSNQPLIVDACCVLVPSPDPNHLHTPLPAPLAHGLLPVVHQLDSNDLWLLPCSIPPELALAGCTTRCNRIRVARTPSPLSRSRLAAR
jgi:hypothetical protein